jgi:hypothetical protein
MQNLIHSIFVFMSSEFYNFMYFLFLKLFLDEPAMVLRYHLLGFRIWQNGQLN